MRNDEHDVTFDQSIFIAALASVVAKSATVPWDSKQRTDATKEALLLTQTVLEARRHANNASAFADRCALSLLPSLVQTDYAPNMPNLTREEIATKLWNLVSTATEMKMADVVS